LQPSRFTIAILQRALSFLVEKPNVAFRGTSESEFAEKSLEKMGIPRHHIELEGRARSIRENAINTMRLVMPQPRCFDCSETIRRF
jgi:hypothetical protein